MLASGTTIVSFFLLPLFFSGFKRREGEETTAERERERERERIVLYTPSSKRLPYSTPRLLPFI